MTPIGPTATPYLLRSWATLMPGQYAEPSGSWSTVSMDRQLLLAQQEQKQEQGIPAEGLAGPDNEIPWAITKDENKTYDDLFSAWDGAHRGFIDSPTAVKMMSHDCGLDLKDCETICELADFQNSGRLNVTEFSIAMHLVDRRLSGYPVPDKLPPKLAKMDSSIGKMTRLGEAIHEPVTALEQSSRITEQPRNACEGTSPTTSPSPAESCVLTNSMDYAGKLESRQKQDDVSTQIPVQPTVDEISGKLKPVPPSSSGKPLDLNQLLSNTALQPVKPQTGTGNVSSEDQDTLINAIGRDVLIKCAHCQEKIPGRFVRALGRTFHVDCFKCKGCGQIVCYKFFPFDEEDGSGQFALCETDYFRRLDLLCFECSGALRGSHITALGRKYHIEHFTCFVCPTIFGAQDNYYEHDSKVYCHYHYSTQFAQHCNGCQTAILEQFVEIFHNSQDQHWYPECHMIHKYWNVRLAPSGPALPRPEVGANGGR